MAPLYDVCEIIYYQFPYLSEVLLEMKSCGICGTDMHAYTEGIDERYVTLPVVLGHESSAVVKRVGAGVTSLKPGTNGRSSYIGYNGSWVECRCQKGGSRGDQFETGYVRMF